MREFVLRGLYKMFPFDLRGDCLVPDEPDGVVLSCVINFFGRIDLLEGILFSLAEQDLPRESFEVLLVEDRGGTEDGRKTAERFSRILPIRYLPLDKQYGQMGYSRNFALARSRGRYVLFLDDDTLLCGNYFLSRLISFFEQNPNADALIPHGYASYSLISGRYDYHDPYFMTSRCTAYRRSALAELGGFMSDFIGQEDVEFVIRFFLAGKRGITCPDLEYRHPPLLVPNFRKPMAVGMSFSGLRKRYSSMIWLVCILNCSRHAPLFLLPGRRNREMGRFGIGFFLGVVASLFKKQGFQYT